MKKNKRIKKSIQLDLHGYTYDEAKIKTEDFVLNNQHALPVDIITGNSDEMKKVVRQVLNYYGFLYNEGDFYNNGYIKVKS